MTTRIGSISPGMTLATPEKRSGLAVPPGNGVGQPLFEHLDIVDVMALQCTPDNDALHGFSHVEPGTRIGCVQQTNTMLGTPLRQVATAVSHEIVQDQQHANGREPAIELISRWVEIPILPATS